MNTVRKQWAVVGVNILIILLESKGTEWAKIALGGNFLCLVIRL